MKKECRECLYRWNELSNDHPEFEPEAIAILFIADLENHQWVMDCSKKICVPWKDADKVMKGILSEPNGIYDSGLPVRKEGFFMRRARETVENKILDEVQGHPDKYTAFSAATKCGCNNCVSEYNSWIDMYFQGSNKGNKFKKPLRGEKHIDY